MDIQYRSYGGSNFRRAWCLVFLILITAPVFGQLTMIKGRVKASSGETLPGVTVFVKGTNTGTNTNLEGFYEIEAKKGDVLSFSYIGYITVDVIVANEVVVNVTLTEDTKALDDIVVIGYGTTSIKDATGSLTSVSQEDFNKGNIVTAENLLSGRVPGLSITTGGAPGSGSTIRIRGGASLGASNDPLIVINGLPIDNNAVGGSRSILSTINPNDIESFTVLKDASATAIFGSRASNGVIIITTKEARGELSVNLDLQTNVSQLVSEFEVFSADEYRNLITEERPDLVSQLGNANTNWQNEIYQTGVSSNLNLSAQGIILDKLPARISIGRSFQEGLRLTSEFERNSGSINLTPKFLKDALSVTVNANYSRENNRFAAGQEGNAIRFDPTQPVFDSESPFGGFFQYFNLNGDGVLDANDLTPLAPFNPVAELLQRENRSEVDRVFGNVKLEYDLPFFPELKAVLNLGYDQQSSTGFNRVSNENPLSQSDGSLVGSSSTYSNYKVNRLMDGYLNYTKEFTDISFDGIAGYSYQKFKSSSFFSGELLNDQPDSEPVFSSLTDLVLVGYFGRANISYVNKYYLTLSYRRDASSRFSPDNRWGSFPAAAASWKLSEDLFPGHKVISSLKLRVGWGITGQQDIGSNRDLFLQRYAIGQPSSQYQFGNRVINIGVPQFRNEIIKWEETMTTNIGLDFGLFNDRFYGSLEYFRKESSDLLANAAISDGSNFSNAGFQNVGNFTSQGLEFSINGDVLSRDNGFNWNINFNTTLIKQEIESLALGADQLVGGIAGGVGNTIQINRVGFSPFMFHVFKQVYDEQGNPIEGGYADLNGDNVINQDDRYLHQNGIPDVTMGFLSNMSYKKFDLSFNLRVALGNSVYNNVNSAGGQLANIQLNNSLSNLPKSVLDTRFTTTEDVILSDIYLEDASFLKLDNITLGYSLGSPFKGIKSARISGGVQNVFVITNYSGIDPEVFGNGIDNTIYPRARTYFLALNLSF